MTRLPFTRARRRHHRRAGQHRRTYDINVDGVAHHGLSADWVEDLARGPEAYLRCDVPQKVRAAFGGGGG